MYEEVVDNLQFSDGIDRSLVLCLVYSLYCYQYQCEEAYNVDAVKLRPIKPFIR